MRTYSNWKKEISLYLSSYINSLELKMLKKLKQKIINEIHIWNISFFGVIKRDPYMEHLYYDVIESNLKLNSNNLEKSTESLLRGIPLNTEYKHEVLTT